MSIEFCCHAELPVSSADLAAEILRLENWPQFAGAGPLPGIRSAEFERRTPEVVGTRIRVTSRDGSQHTEEITVWQPDRRLVLEFGDFTPPLTRLAEKFIETWDLQPTAAGVRVARSFALYPKRGWAWPMLWAISWLLKAAVQKHLREMIAANRATGEPRA